MSRANEILRSYVRLVARLSGAVLVSLYVPPVAGEDDEILIHEGRIGPLPELADAAAAAESLRRLGASGTAEDDSKGLLAGGNAEGLLYRIPLRWLMPRAEEDAAGPLRRRGDRTPAPELTTLIGLRFERESGARGRDLLWFATAADALSDEGWWKEFLGLAAGFAAHARTVSKTTFDQVTELPERANFQAELEVALAQVQAGDLPAVLLLLGPDDFGWVNDRLDRRLGDQVLREIATVLAAGLRSQDHVARY